MLRLLLMLGLLAVAAPGCSDSSYCDQSAGCTRVLFVGNSYTAGNDLPAMFTQLAVSGGHRVGAGLLAQGSWTLADHASSKATATKLASTQWDTVVLQEQSQLPSVDAVHVDPDGAVVVLSRNVLDLQIELPRLAKSAAISLRRVEPLDDSLESVFGYLVEG